MAETPVGARPGMISLNIREKPALYMAYMMAVKEGGLFIPTPKPYRLGDTVFLLLGLMDDPTKIPVEGKVVWVTPAKSHFNRTQGVGIQFKAGEGSAVIRKRIEDLLGMALQSSRLTHSF